MKIHRKLLVFTVLCCLFLSACGSEAAPAAPTEATAPAETVDYAALLTLDQSSATAKEEVTVKSYVDGDTAHFYVDERVVADGVLKARFLAVNTPESTGMVEEFGKTAANFTKEKLSAATSIIIESESENWEKDTTGDRYLVWVWYKTDADESYRNLNVELLQNALARPNSSANNQYGSTCMAAIEQSKREKLNLYSGEPDPNFFYGDAVELTLKELRTNIESYNGMKVAFSGVITTNSGTQGVYVEDFDPETNLPYGIYVYYGHGLSGSGLDILTVGNESRIVGTVQYYEAGGTWQISGVSHRMMQPDDPDNLRKLSTGHSAPYTLTEADTFVNGLVGEEEIPYAAAVQGTTIQMQGLQVLEVYTTQSGGSSDGAMTLTCEADGVRLSVRTAVLTDEAGNVITGEAYLGKTIDVKGVVDFFDGTYQIKVLTANNITIKE